MGEIYDIAIIGGGASGLAAAISAAKNSDKRSRIVILEGNAKLGKKLLATGNGRCNLTNMHADIEKYHGDTAMVKTLFAEYTPEKIRSCFKDIGLYTISDEEGRVYPYNKQAAAVLEILKNAAETSGVDCITDFKVFSVIKPGKFFIIKSVDGTEIKAKKCIIAAGGKASPRLSCGEDTYSIVKSLGHSVKKLYPVLVQLKSADKFLKNISGMRCRAQVALYGDGIKIKEELGEVLFADKAVSGICVFDLSVPAAEYFATGSVKGKRYDNLFVQMDLAPDLNMEEIRDHVLRYASMNPNVSAGDVLAGLLNIKVGREIVRRCKIDTLAPAGCIDKIKAERIAKTVKSLRLKVDGTRDWQDAQVTAGGVPLKELDTVTLESKIVKGLYFCGEILNIHGDCGGFNLHFAWLSGIRAGLSAAER